jgi:hypothetical protein
MTSDELRMLPGFELRASDVKGTALDDAQQHIV